MPQRLPAEVPVLAGAHPGPDLPSSGRGERASGGEALSSHGFAKKYQIIVFTLTCDQIRKNLGFEHLT